MALKCTASVCDISITETPCGVLTQGTYRYAELSYIESVQCTTYVHCISIEYTNCKRHTDKTSRDHSQFACCNQTVTTINKWWTPLSSLVFMGLCVCARILNHNMVKYTLQLCRKEMTVIMEFLVGNLKFTNLIRYFIQFAMRYPVCTN